MQRWSWMQTQMAETGTGSGREIPWLKVGLTGHLGGAQSLVLP